MDIQKEISRTIEGLYIILDYLDEQTTKQDKIKIVDFQHGCMAEINNNQKSKVPNLAELRAARGLDVSQFNNLNNSFFNKNMANQKPKIKENDMPKLKNIYVYERKNGYYQAIVYYKKSKKCFTNRDRNKAIQNAKEFLKTVVEKHDNYEIFGTLLRFWLDSVKRPFISKMYYTTLNSVSEKYILSRFGNSKIRDILPITLQSYFAEMAAISTRNCEDIKTIISGVFEYAIGNNFITNNPMRAVTVPKHERVNGQALSLERLAIFKRKIESHKVYKLPYLIYLYTGCRSSEYASIEFNFVTNVVKIKNSKLKKWQKNAYRELPILKMLLPYRAEIEEGKWRTVFLSELVKTFKEIVPEGNIRWLRHTYQTYCRKWASKEMVNMWAGHVIASDMTDQIYNHISMEDQQKAAKDIVF